MPNQLSRRAFVRTAALTATGLALAPKWTARAASSGQKPNLIVFLPDQQRADTLGCYGARHALAPNLDKFASQSFVFQQAYITQPVCSPSRSSVMTSTWPNHNGVTHNSIPLASELQCLPQMLGDSDYHCAYMGKWHLGAEDSEQRGFTEWVSIIDDHELHGSKEPTEISDYDRFLTARGLKPNKHGRFSSEYASTLPIELSKTRFLETSAIDFLQKHRDEPFILFVAFFEPHPPYNGPLNEYHPLHKVEDEPTANHIFGKNMPLRYRLRQELHGNEFRSDEPYRRTKQKYYGLVTQLDLSVGAILTKLEELGLTDKTIVVHTSDHGDMMGAHHLFGKEVMFEPAIRVPYLVRMPGQRQAVPIAPAVSHIDLVPTLLDALGGQPHPQCSGQSRAAFLRGEIAPGETIFMQWNPDDKTRASRRTRLATAEQIAAAESEQTRAALSVDGWKLCLRTSDKNELYNIKADPQEMHNLYSEKRHRHIIARLTGEIHKWQESIGDTARI